MLYLYISKAPNLKTRLQINIYRARDGGLDNHVQTLRVMRSRPKTTENDQKRPKTTDQKRWPETARNGSETDQIRSNTIKYDQIRSNTIKYECLVTASNG